ncbi:MAG: ERCC4 domain-containing protein [Planctomycetota bacterium]|jgi:ERCC4-type nuclease
MKLPSKLEPDQITAVIDTREQIPLSLEPLQVEYGTLTTGDYSVKGLEHVVAIERKSLPDLLACVGTERARFEKQVQRLLAYPVRALAVEASWSDIEAGQWASKVTPQAALGSLLGWVTSGLPVIMGSDHTRCGRYVARLLYTAARRRYRECRELVRRIVEMEPVA